MALQQPSLHNFKAGNLQHAHSHTRPGHISSETDEIIVFSLLANATLILVGGALWLLYDAFFRQRQVEQDTECTPLIPKGCKYCQTLALSLLFP